MVIWRTDFMVLSPESISPSRIPDYIFFSPSSRRPPATGSQMNEPSTSTHQFQRYIWEDFSARRARNRAQSDRDNKDWNNAPGKYFY